jgi:YbgC/YbaW family acyl-CoA thioester hydrolase
MEDLGAQIVVTDIETRFLAPGLEGDELVVETWVEEIKRVSTLFGQRIVRGDDVLATQKVRGACTTLTGRPTRFPTELLAGMEPYLVKSS